MPEEFELSPADIVTIGTIGPPGQRVFHLQAKQGDTLLTVIIEKVQAAAISESIVKVLEEIQKEYELETPEPDLSAMDLDLQEPILPLFRVGQIGLGYDHENDLLMLIVSELLPDEEGGDPRLARIGATRSQMRALAAHAGEVVAAGRPICGNCGQPIDPEGHFCPRSNGHRKPVSWA